MGRTKHNLILDLDETCVLTWEQCSLRQVDLLSSVYPERFYTLIGDEDVWDSDDGSTSCPIECPPCDLSDSSDNESEDESDYNMSGNESEDESECGDRTNCGDLRLSKNSQDSKLYGIVRPFWKEFRAFAFANFDTVSVWSAGEYQYVHDLVDKLFEPSQRPFTVMTRNDLRYDEDGSGAYYKDLSRFFDKYPAMNERNTVLVDDRIDTSEYFPKNVVQCSTYNVLPDLYDVQTDMDSELYRIALLFDDEGWFQSDDIRPLIVGRGDL